MIHTTDSEASTRGEYCAIETADGDLLVYDRGNPQAWIQSSHAIPVPRAERS